MRKKVVSFILTLVMLFTLAPAETYAMVSGDDGRTPGTFPVGGMQLPEPVEISEEAAERIGVINEEDIQSGGRLQQYSPNYASQLYYSIWDVYSSNYVYNRLGAKERRLWDLFDTQGRLYLTSTRNASRGYVKGSMYYVTAGINFAALGLERERAGEVYQLFLYANPQYYFFDGGFLHTPSVLFPEFYDTFANGLARKGQTEEMQYQINLMKAEVEKGATDLEKARIAHDIIIQKVMYDDYYGTSFQNTPYHQSAYSVFCDSYTVCAGYTKAFELLLNAVGIDTIGVTSYNNLQRAGHAWNAVCLNDSWYYVDCTWDDTDGWNGLELVYSWFGLSEATLTGDRDQHQAHQPQSFYLGLLPSCTRDMGSTQYEVGTVYIPVQTVAAPRITQNKTKNGINVTLKSATPGADIYYTTDGKNPSASFSRSYHYTGTFTVNADVTLKAIAVCDGKKDSPVATMDVKGKQYTVKFNTLGGSKIVSQNIWPQGVASKPANPKRKNHKFDGWYSDRGCRTKWNFGSRVTKNVTLYAKWTKVKVKQTSVRSLKNKSGGKLDVTVRKVSDAKGYQIRYSTKSSMKSSRKVLTKSNKKTLSRLKNGQTYYVQVRAYKLDSAKNKVYGKWSGKKTITIRK